MPRSLAYDAADRVVTELRRKFGTVEAVLARLGLDAALLETNPNGGIPMAHYRPGDRRRFGRDEGEGPLTSREAEEAIADIFNALPAEEAEQLADSLRDVAGDFRAWAADGGHHREGEDARRRRSARDEPPPFEGRPEPGGTMTRLDNEGTDRRREAEDRRRREAEDKRRFGRHAQDSAWSSRETSAFERRFGRHAASIQVM